MSVAKLKTILLAPKVPMESGTADRWSEVESRLRTGLPADYKEFIADFGTGCICDFLWVFNPFASNPHLNLVTQFEEITKTELESKSLYGSMFPLELFPMQGGLLPVGVSDNGDYLCWLTEGSPNQWPVVVCESRAPEWERFELTICDFLASILNRSRVCGVFPRKFPPATLTFRPATQNANQ